MINFILPGFYENFNLNIKFLELFNENRKVFRDEVNIASVFGNFQLNIFDGGRNFTYLRQCSKEEMEIITDIFNNKFKTPMRLICTNPVVTEDQYRNRFANLQLKICENEMNEIIINNEGLEAYIRENYPGYKKYVSSTTKCITKVDKVNEELNNPNYYMVCLDYNVNHYFNYLEKLPQEIKDKTEFLINAICPSGCPSRKTHYRVNGLFQTSYGKSYSLDCSVNHTTVSPEARNYPNTISPDELYNTYVPMGFSNFKIEGRTIPSPELAENYVYYMIKPEYQSEILVYLLGEQPMDKLQKMVIPQRMQ